MFALIKTCFCTGLAFLSTLTSKNMLSCISINNQECKVRPQIVNVNSKESVFSPFSIKTSKCNGSCNNMNDPYAKICVPDVVKNLDVKVFNLMSGANETRHIEWYQTCNVHVDLIAVFLIINNARMTINADVNAKNWLIKMYAIKDLFGIWLIVSANVINHVVLVNISTMKIVSAGKN